MLTSLLIGGCQGWRKAVACELCPLAGPPGFVPRQSVIHDIKGQHLAAAGRETERFTACFRTAVGGLMKVLLAKLVILMKEFRWE